MSEISMFTNDPAPARDLPLPVDRERFPDCFRLMSFSHAPVDHRTVRCEATLYHDAASARVAWHVRQPDLRLRKGALVGVRWTARPTCSEGCIGIARLVLIEIPVPGFDLLKTVPPEWVRDRALVARAGELLQLLSPAQRHLFNAIFWESGRFHRFLSGPSSLRGHHDRLNGNFRHSIDVAERCLTLAAKEPRVALGILVLSALLHDAGKADEYRYDRCRRVFEMSARGALIGHRHTIVEWIAAALATRRIGLSEAEHHCLLHCLTAGKGGDFLGIRPPMAPEAMILSNADRMSGMSDLISRNASSAGGFGSYHKHLGGRPFVIAPRELSPAVL
jgi:3'-5' exoribonuclease